MDEAREHEAGRLFGVESLNAVMSAAAAQGQSVATFAPTVPMDLSQTPTAKATQLMLEKAGFLVEWKQVQPRPDAERTTVMRVSWGVDAKATAE